jgi:NAD(P)H dehydrogenase (quinone)
MAKIAIVYYSSEGHAHQVAAAYEEGARNAGAETRLRRVPELAPDEAIASNQGWAAHLAATQNVPEATLADLEWADGFVFGAPTRFGNMASQMKQFIDTTGPLWAQGKLANKAVTAFTGAMNAHGGQESSILAFYTSMFHWGAVIVPPGYTDPRLFAAGGNPYGVSYTAPYGDPSVPPEVLEAARYSGERLARYATVIAKNLDSLLPTPQEAREGAEAAGAEV